MQGHSERPLFTLRHLPTAFEAAEARQMTEDRRLGKAEAGVFKVAIIDIIWSRTGDISRFKFQILDFHSHIPNFHIHFINAALSGLRQVETWDTVLSCLERSTLFIVLIVSIQHPKRFFS